VLRAHWVVAETCRQTDNTPHVLCSAYALGSLQQQKKTRTVFPSQAQASQSITGPNGRPPSALRVAVAAAAADCSAGIFAHVLEMQPSTRLGRVVQVVELLADPTGGALLAARPTVLLAGGLHGDDAASASCTLIRRSLWAMCVACVRHALVAERVVRLSARTDRFHFPPALASVRVRWANLHSPLPQKGAMEWISTGTREGDSFVVVVVPAWR
jgi:hypothetical protein